MFFAPAPDQDLDILRPIDPMLDRTGPPRLGEFGIAPIDPMFPSDVGTPVVDIFNGGGHQFASPALNGISDVLDVFSVVRFLAEGR